jgi:hypothetical protein
LGELAHELRGGRAPKRRGLAHGQLVATEDEHRGARLTLVQASLFDLDEHQEQPREQLTALIADRLGMSEQLVVGDVRDFHATCLPSRFSSLQEARGGTFAAIPTSKLDFVRIGGPAADPGE